MKKRVKDIINQENIATIKEVLMKSIKSHPVNVDGTKRYLVTKFNNMHSFYKEVTGLDELEYYQNRVIELQNTLNEAQQKRREINFVLTDIRKKNTEIQDSLHKVNRHADRNLFLNLIRDETEYSRQEKEVFETMREQERYERDVFTAFTNAIRDSQEKQRNRLEYAKYIGFTLTVMGAFASYLITTWRTEDLKNVIRYTIKDDVKKVIVETSSNTLNYIKEMNKEQIESQSRILERVAGLFKADVESVKTSSQSRFQQMEQAVHSLTEYTYRLASKLKPAPEPQPSTIQWTWTQIIGIGSATLVLLGLITFSK